VTPPWFISIPLVLSLGAAPQQAQVRNAQIEERDVPIERAVASIGTSADAVWVGWRVPMVGGLRDLCGTWSDGVTTVRGATLEDGTRAMAPTVPTDAGGATNLEAGTSLLVWLRVLDGQVERLRVVSDDCPVDAGGRQVIWLRSTPAADSARYLGAFLTLPTPSSDHHRRLAASAVMAIALHADRTAETMIDGLLTPTTDAALRRSAADWLARAGGARGFSRLTAVVRSNTDTGVRRAAAAAIVQTRQPDTLSTLWRMAETDADDEIRAGALAGYAELAPEADLARLTARLATEPSQPVRQRAVRGLARRPATSGVPALVALARTSTDAAVRTEAVRALSRSSDPAAIAYLTEVLR
jgi:hypothetical protein